MLEISFTSKLDPKAENIGLFVSKDGVLGKEGQKVDALYAGAISHALKIAKNFKGKEGQVLPVLCPTRTQASRLFIVGLGDAAKAKGVVLDRIGAKLAAALEQEGVAAASFQIEKIKRLRVPLSEAASRIAQGAQLRLYSFDKYKTKKKENVPKLKELTFALPEAAKAKRAFAPLQKISEGVFMARDLASEPANVLYPESFAKEALALKKLGVKVQVLDKAQMEKLGMGSLLSVSQGSDRPPRLVCMSWNGAPQRTKDKRPIALIGKGVTFDTGGISLKPPAGMGDMKYDMCGAAAVVGAMKAIAGRNAKANVVGLIGLVENMPSGGATRPGDVVISASGQTIEVLNTDAEGRLVLADVIWYAQKQFSPKCLVDIATLTGAMGIALGKEYAGLFSNQDKLAKALAKGGEESGELLWRMPMAEVFDKMIDSPIADVKNIGGREAGSCTAAQFIQRFVNDDTDWAHIDVAGTSYNNKDNAMAPKGPTAFGVRLLDRFVANYGEK